PAAAQGGGEAHRGNGGPGGTRRAARARAARGAAGRPGPGGRRGRPGEARGGPAPRAAAGAGGALAAARRRGAARPRPVAAGPQPAAGGGAAAAAGSWPDEPPSAGLAPSNPAGVSGTPGVERKTRTPEPVARRLRSRTSTRPAAAVAEPIGDLIAARPRSTIPKGRVWMDKLDEGLKALLESGKEKGYLTYSQVN